MFMSADSVTSKRLTQNLLFIACLLQFNLGFGDLGRLLFANSTRCSHPYFFRLALMHGSGSSDLDSVAYPLFIDTLYFVIDELHSQSKTRTTDLFKYYPNMSENELSTDIPTGYYRQLFTFLPQLPPNKIVTDLVHAHRDISGRIVFGAPVQNRPWEWIENLGEPAVEEDAHRWQEGPFKNTPSLSLELFAARRTGEHIPHPNLIHDITKPNDHETNIILSRVTYDRSRTGYPRRVSIDGIGVRRGWRCTVTRWMGRHRRAEAKHWTRWGRLSFQRSTPAPRVPGRDQQERHGHQRRRSDLGGPLMGRYRRDCRHRDR
ncbi:hypothetical protein JVU11DRAFT_9332 [Chiua virens]|nr:hypothetical protein JVU11DRAFT_9332 [Chiua virens]